MDSLRINERLEQLRAVDVRSIDKNDLIDLNQVTIDETKPVPERVAEFMRQIQNPYCFRIGDVVIKVVYKENGPSFQICCKQYEVWKVMVFGKTGRLISCDMLK